MRTLAKHAHASSSRTRTRTRSRTRAPLAVGPLTLTLSPLRGARGPDPDGRGIFLPRAVRREKAGLVSAAARAKGRRRQFPTLASPLPPAPVVPPAPLPPAPPVAPPLPVAPPPPEPAVPPPAIGGSIEKLSMLNVTGVAPAPAWSVFSCTPKTTTLLGS